MNKTLITATLALLASLSLSAAVEDWQTTAVNSRNREPMQATIKTDCPTTSLNGVWKFKWYESPAERSSDFFKTSVDDSTWDDMKVPGLWEMNGYGDPVYLNVGYAWRGHYKNNPPVPPTENNHVGQYRRHFTWSNEWAGKDIFLTIGSATSNVRVWINGKEVGYSEDSKLEATFNITKYLVKGDNLVALEVFRWCDGTYMEDQDFWRFSGLARDTYITAKPKQRISDLRITAGADGKYDIRTTCTKGVKNVTYFMSGPGMAEKEVKASGTVASPALWSAEAPNLYHLKAVCKGSKGITETAELDFGFRTVEIRNAQLLVNGQPVLIKGADRHEMNATGGYVVSEADMIRDIRIMKQLNINAVRTSHYPNDPRWYALCDKYGLYVIDEANNESHGMGYGQSSLAHDPQYAATQMERVKRMMQRDMNHPSIIIWSLGNESGNGVNFEEAYKFAKSFDSTRPVQYERAEGAWNSDINCPMYVNYKNCEQYCTSNPSKPLIQCEYAHAMGNSIGGLKEYWDLIRKYPVYQGGFIWDFVDQAVRWPSKSEGTDHIYAFGGDFNEYEPSDNSFNCNGIIAADRSYHPHAYEVAYQYQNLWASAIDVLSGKIGIHNENFFTGTEKYMILWEIVSNGVPAMSGCVNDFNVAPQQTECISLGYTPSDIGSLEGEIFLNIRFVLKRSEPLLPAGFQVAYAQLPVREKAYEPAAVCLNGSKWSAHFNGEGALDGYYINGRNLVKEPLMPCFGRAVTENDLGARFEKKMKPWLYPEFKLVESEASDDRRISRYEVEGLCKVDMIYDIHPDGRIEVTEHVYDIAENAPYMFRVGAEMEMGGDFSNLDFYGNGPFENYADRNSAAITGLYSQRVEDQYHWGYVRPQESGTHTELRWMRITDDSGCGFEIYSPKAFSASALPLSRKDIDMSITGGGRSDRNDNVNPGDQRHSLELRHLVKYGERSIGKTCINIDLVQMGLGSINSWGEKPKEEYMIPAGEYTFVFSLIPRVRN